MSQNLSIFSLTATSLSNSPYLSPGRAFFLHVSRSNFNRFNGNFIRSDKSRLNIHIDQSKFSRFLDSAIQINRIDIASQTFTERNIFSEDSMAIIKQSIFSSCSSEKNGGAVYINNKNSQVQFEECIFKQCKTSIHGGAMYIISNNFWARGCQFTECQAGPSHSYQTFSITCESETYIAFCTCANNEASEDGFSTFATKFGRRQTIDMLNVTSCKTQSWGSCACCSLSFDALFLLSRGTFVNNSQPKTDGFIFFGGCHDCQVVDSNVVENKVSDNGTLFTSVNNAYVYVRGCVLKNNQFKKLGSNGDTCVVFFDSCEIDKRQEELPRMHFNEFKFNENEEEIKTIDFHEIPAE